ncbi:hypothetical protein AYI69_g1407 [Smittium culicis]|uniref:Uncharacterized protein n=1 Tax=Smittium culicis TaxID=133412 RepID=A0A1R1YQC4_9FUNG|nr:hypothetical protein AYI69_g1407 [Smittium culicis]
MDRLTKTQAPASQDQVKLTEALPSIEEDFFRTPLTEEERKIAVHSCPKTSSMNYTLPPLNDTATMRALLSKITTTVTQTRLDNLHKGLKLPEKPTQLVKSDAKPLMDQEALDALIAKKPAAKRQRIQLFRWRQQSTIPRITDSSNTVKAQSTTAATTTEVNHKTHYRQSNFRGRGRGLGKVSQ